MAANYFTLEWKQKFEEGLAKEWRFNSLRNPVEHTVALTDGNSSLRITSSTEKISVEVLDSKVEEGQVLYAPAEIWNELFTDELESLTRLVRQGRVELLGDSVSTLLRWRLVFATVEALALTVRGEI